MPPDDSLIRFKRVVAAALAELENRRQEVNDLNVFPVADGDTGDNMALTMRAVVEELNTLDDNAMDKVGRDAIVSAVARAALLGARGNSGVILSQVVRGAAEELASRPGELVDPVLVSAALARAADAAYESVRDPAEGTMLTAVRAMASRVAHDLAHMDPQRLGPEATAVEQDELLAEVLENALEAGKEAVARGPEQLAVLRDAGVVDAGAYGLTVIIAGCLAALRGMAAPQLEHQYAPAALHRPEHESSSFRYCTNFAVTGESLDARRFTPELERLGDSVLVVGDDRTLRVHVHTDDPDAAVALFEPAGEVSRFDVADMHEQVADRSARLAGEAPQVDQATCAVVAVASGEGVKRLFGDLGVLVVEGGATMNPSTYELLAGIHAAPGAEVVVLPNSQNVILAAERACELSEKPAAVVPTTAPQEGLASLLAFDPERSAQANAAAVSSATEALRIGGVAPAARDDAQGRFIAGDAVGYAGGELVAWGDPAATLAATLDQLVDGAELLTCIAGEAPPLDQDGVQARVPDGVELEYHEGGQPAWWWLLCAE
jgi:DAK2 domain fusion protein YloV